MLKLSLWIHVMAAIFWIGGMLFLTLVIAPFLKGIEDPQERSRIYHVVGRRFRLWGWIAIGLLLLTGPLNLYLMGLPLEGLLSGNLYRGPYGKTLITKLAFVVLIVITSFLHDFVFGPRARGSRYYGTLARWIGRGNLLMALFIAFLAVALRLGGL